MRTGPGWTGAPHKQSRVYSVARRDAGGWPQAMIAHVWTGASGPELVLDPARGVDADGRVVTTTYNDFAHLAWLGARRGAMPVYADAPAGGPWRCVEAHVRLNDPGTANGVFELWVDGVLDARIEGLDWVGRYTDYGINALALENHWNGGAPAWNVRWRDELAVSVRRIGCGPLR